MWWYYLLAVIIIVADQITKWIIVRFMEIGDTVPVIGEFFQITSHRNKGAAFGILQDQRLFFIIITIVILAGLIWYMQKMSKEGSRLLHIALGLVLGGAVGNFIDRLLTGEVVDFLKFRFQFNWFGSEVDYTYPIFNVADSAIVIGVALIFLDTLLAWRKERREA